MPPRCGNMTPPIHSPGILLVCPSFPTPAPSLPRNSPPHPVPGPARPHLLQRPVGDGLPHRLEEPLLLVRVVHLQKHVGKHLVGLSGTAAARHSSGTVRCTAPSVGVHTPEPRCSWLEPSSRAVQLENDMLRTPWPSGPTAQHGYQRAALAEDSAAQARSHYRTHSTAHGARKACVGGGPCRGPYLQQVVHIRTCVAPAREARAPCHQGPAVQPAAAATAEHAHDRGGSGAKVGKVHGERQMEGA